MDVAGPVAALQNAAAERESALEEYEGQLKLAHAAAFQAPQQRVDIRVPKGSPAPLHISSSLQELAEVSQGMAGEQIIDFMTSEMLVSMRGLLLKLQKLPKCIE